MTGRENIHSNSTKTGGNLRARDALVSMGQSLALCMGFPI
jgi:hypothetical protein